MALQPIHWIVLSRINTAEFLDLRFVSEPLRQRLIDLAMMDPPLVDVDADQVFLTRAGRELLHKTITEPQPTTPET
jgi:hypothetical protein